MFRPTPFTQSDIARSTVARRKNGKVRYFDPQTARMSGWLKVDSSLISPATPEEARAVLFASNRSALEPLTVANLQSIANTLGVAFTTRMRKAALIEAITTA